MDTSSVTPQGKSPKQPKKYIRTFAGDMETLQRGGAPELVPLQEVGPITAGVPAEVPQGNSSTVDFSHLGPIPDFAIDTSRPRVQEPKIEEKHALESAAAQSHTPREAVTLIPEQQNNLGKPSPLQTYSGDFSDYMKDTQASPATVLAAQQDASLQMPMPELGKKKSHTVLYISGGILLLVAGCAGIYVAFTKSQNTPTPVVVAPTVISAPIFTEDKEQISGTGVALLQSVLQSLDRQLASNTIRFLYSERVTSTDNSIFSALQLPAPYVLLRNLNSEGSMAGIINNNGTQSIFFILSVASYGETFSGMLAWEKTMQRDLEAIFPPHSVPQATTAPIATTTPPTSTSASTTTATSTNPVANKPIGGFRDEVINNHDARAYRDSLKRTVFVYGYWDQKTLVIARDPVTFTEVLNRLSSARTQP